jgi:hypothetical protein
VGIVEATTRVDADMVATVPIGASIVVRIKLESDAVRDA